MCIACNLKNGERIVILEPSTTDYKVYVENTAGVYRLHMEDGRHHNTRDINHCMFCGRRLAK